MTEVILSPVASMIIEMLGSAAMKKIGELYSVRDDLEELKGTLVTIRSVLHDAERQQIHNNQVRLWLQRLEEVVSDVDDLVDEVATEGMCRDLMHEGRKVSKQICICFSISNRLVIQRKLASKIRRIRKRLSAITADRRDFTLDVTTTPMRIRRETHSFVVEDNVFGRFEDKKTVLKMILEKDNIGERVRVISIFGMGGLGKTTLAQLIFNNDIVQERFDEKIWVCVSDDFDIKVILRSVVRSLIGMSTRVDDNSIEELQKTLREKMNGKSYILVLDDVWSENHQSWWDLMDILSSCGVSGSRIVVTTRSEVVAKLTSNNISYVCLLGILSDEDSWSLFKKIAIKQRREPVEEKIGKEIVRKCGGIPLAIKMLGSMLSIRDPKTEWPSFLNKELSSLPQQQNDILPTLKLSYDYLQSHLKQCFAYCRLFSKDCLIDVSTLIMLWVAQGFISASSYDHSRVLEDIGYDHFLELLGRCFFQEAKFDEITDRVVTCKMHDLVHDLAIQVAGEEYVYDIENINEKVRHASLGSKASSLLFRARRLRSLLLLKNRAYCFFESITLEEVVSNLTFLRTLDLNFSKIKIVPNTVGKLKHLRYLDLSGTGIRWLPDSITELVNLQTLKINDCSFLRELPRDMKKLINLKHLEFRTPYSYRRLSLPKGVSQLTNLQTLSYFMLSDPTAETESTKLDEIMGLNNLKGTLEITGLRDGIETKGGNLKEKQHLRSLRLIWIWSGDGSNQSYEEGEKTLDGLNPHTNLKRLIVQGYGGARFSNWLFTLTNLFELELHECNELNKISSLEPLCSLRKMYLFECNELEFIALDVVSEDCYFPVLPSLQQLELRNLKKFRGWESPNTTENARPYFPCLSNLVISQCPELISLPLYPNVKELSLVEANRKSFEQTVLMSIARPQISALSTFYPLSVPTDLRLFCPGETDVLRGLPDWMRSFSSVETLEMCGYSMFQCTSQFYDRTMEWEIGIGFELETPIIGYERREIFSSVRKLVLTGLPTMKHPSRVIKYMASLEELFIDSCKEIDGNESIEFESLTSLRSIVFNGLKDVVALPEWLQRINTLRSLKLYYCPNLKTICKLSSLHKLHIRDCPNLFEGLDNPNKWESLTSLHTLILTRLPELITLPEGLRCITTLQTLELDRCINLKALPKWIFHKTESLPGSISVLTSLQNLWIYECPLLLERYGKETGEDWPKIKHIPNVLIQARYEDVEVI